MQKLICKNYKKCGDEYCPHKTPHVDELGCCNIGCDNTNGTICINASLYQRKDKLKKLEQNIMNHNV